MGWLAGRRSLWRGLPPYGESLAVAAALGLIADSALVRGPQGAEYWVFASGLALAFGTGFGLLLSLSFVLLGALPRWLRVAGVCTASIAIGALFAQSLAAFARLSGRYFALALGTLVACAVGAALAAALILLSTPAEGAPSGRLASLSRPWRLLVAAALAAAAICVHVLDRRLFVGLYPQVHLLGRVAAVALLGLGVALAQPELRVPRMTRCAVVLLLGWLGLTLVTLDQHRVRALEGLMIRPFPALFVRTARAVLDLDRDGYSGLLGGGDCNDFNGRIHPAAPEIPNNGVDDNCMLGDATHRAPAPSPPVAYQGPVQRSVVLITVDALRPDHMGTYNPAYNFMGRATTPAVDRWSQGALVFRNAFSSGGWTVIALAPMMRGQYARRLLWEPCYETTQYRLVRPFELHTLGPGERLLHYFPVPNADPHPTLAQLLAQRGMITAAVVDDGFSPMLGPGVGLSRGFQRYVIVEQRVGKYHTDRETTNTALAELAGIAPGQHFFLWVHYFGPHTPTLIHAGTPTYGPSIADGYDHEVRFWDGQVARLLAALEQRRPTPTVILAADHGETLGPFSRSHGFVLDEATARIPLMLKGPGIAPAVIDNTVSLIDVFPTILKLTNTPLPGVSDGRDLLSAGLPGEPQQRRLVLTDAWRYLHNGAKVLDVTAVTDGRRILVYDRIFHSMRLLGRGPGALGTRVPTAPNDALSAFVLGYAEETASLALPR